jgi:hypothetical protein
MFYILINFAMSKKAEKIQFYKEKLEELGHDVNLSKLEKIVDMLGPSIYRLDAELVSCSDEGEKERVVENFLIKKLGLKDEPAGRLLEAVNELCEELKEKKRKYRPVFYYILVEKLGVDI